MVISLSFELLQEFLVLSRRLNFSTAAKELCMTQSNLSKHMMELEKKTGLKLISRGYHIALTPAGKEFLRDMTSMLYDFERSVLKCKELQKAEIKELRVHEFEVWTTPARVLYSISQSYKKEYPTTIIDYLIPSHRSPLEALRDNRLDVAVILRSANTANVVEEYHEQGVESCLLVSETAIVWADKSHPLMQKETITVKDLTTTQIITSSGRRFDPMQPVITEMCQNAGFSPNFDNYNINSITEFFMIESGVRSVFVITPQTLKDNRVSERRNMTSRTLDEEEGAISAYLVALENAENPTITDFVEYAKIAAQKLDLQSLLLD